MPSLKFRNAAIVSLVLALLISPAFLPYSSWLVPGMALSIFVIWHTLYASRRVPWIPGLIAVMACVQWIVAPWLTYVFEGTASTLAMPLPADDYFRYFVPGAFALVAGLFAPLVGLRTGHAPRVAPVPAARALRIMSEVMVFGGALARIAVSPRIPGSLHYLATVLDHLMYVGAFTFVILGSKGWWWRAGFVLAVELVKSAIAAQFVDAFIWTLLTALLVAYRYRFRTWKALALGVLGILALFAVNGFKGGFRQSIRHEGIDPAERPGAVFSGFTSIALQPSRLLSGENLAFNVSRLNEGWIAGRVLIWVPYHEPYAEGETIRRAVIGTLVPRVLDPNKMVAGGRTNVPRFTGLELINGTSMNLSIPGEMYANYGHFGGLLGTFLVALVIGFVFRIFVRWGRTSPLAFAWAPYLLSGAISAEMGLFEVFGTLGKTAIIASLIIFGTGAWRAQLPKRRRQRTILAAPSHGTA